MQAKLLIIFLMLFGYGSYAQEATDSTKFWRDSMSRSAGSINLQKAANYRVLCLDVERLWNFVESKESDSTEALILQLPLPDGSNKNLKFVPSRVLPQSLKSKFSQRSFQGTGHGDPTITATLDLMPDKVFITIFTLSDTYVIAPTNGNTGHYVSYNKEDVYRTKKLRPKEKP